MHHRILDFSLSGVQLRIQLNQLKVILNNQTLDSIPLSDIAVVLLANPQITLSQSVLRGLSEAGGVIVICDKKSLPVSLCAPLVGHYKQTNRMGIQALTPKPILKRLWKQIVRKKIEFQAEVLVRLFEQDAGLGNLIQEVRSGDVSNREGIAAKRYWAKLFGESGFRRNQDGKDTVNIALNYGYAIVRAAAARAVCAVGLHPSIGIFHHNMYNPYCLADDLMEPFRPIVDYAVYRLNAENYLSEDLNPQTKGAIISQLTGRYIIDNCQETLFESVTKIAESLCRVFEERDKQLLLPASLPFRTETEFCGSE